MTPVVSVLCPSRGRPDSLTSTVSRLLELAGNPARVQILVAADPDDQATIAADVDLPRPQVSMWVAARRFGYARLHEYFNALAAKAAGEWLMLWNDDAHMLTPGWDEIIAAQKPGILWPEADYAPALVTFPVLPAAWFQALGHLSLDQSADMWLHHVGELAGVLRKIPVAIHHEHVTGDATAAQRDAVATVNTFWTAAMAAAREADAAKLRELAG